MGNLYVLSAPSGAGKTTIAKKLLESVKRLDRAITATTRERRAGEKHGVDYYFMSKEEFEKHIKEGNFLEYAIVYGNYYGTPIWEVERILKEGKDCLLVIDVQGARSVKEKFKDSVLIFVLPPSLEELERRIKSRSHRDKNIEERLKSVEEEIACSRFFDYLVVNEFLDETVDTIRNIILSHRHSREAFLENIQDYVHDERLRYIILNSECKLFGGVKHERKA
ncbi:guanylate kinase [Thermocrinis minervae]|uniref:Guanylate kinase n=1 Tax=Thermocrinis minervae TaxID=381751 RepID=A0A1M6T3S1_9AQUI|nr:guanylate kinase [Thermocrinis minervae]SHK51663.1 guanylate kinase [Thermocrinis minervae]